jgi:membrane associated rhomboid family serine protease
MLKRFTPILAITALCWLVFVVNNLLLQGRLSQYGIEPRHVAGLWGVLWAPFLHGSFEHLAANTLPLLILGGAVCFRSAGEFNIVTVFGIVISGALTWLIGRTAHHIGASGLIFVYFGYLASLAIFDRKFGTLFLSLACVLGYGGIIRGIFPTATPVSWESHAAGLFTGIFLAWLVSKVNKSGEVESPTPAPKLRAP